MMPPVGRGDPTTAAWWPAALALVAMALPLVAFVGRSGPPVDVSLVSVTWLFAVLGAFVLVRRPRHRIGMLYLAAGLEVGAFLLLNSLDVASFPRAAALVLGWFLGAGWAIGPLLVMTFGLLWLPDGRLPSPRWRWFERLTWTALAGVLLGFPLTDAPDEVLRELGVSPALGEIVFVPLVTLVAVAISGCALSPFLRYRRASHQVRQQLRLVGLGGVCAIAVYLAGGTIVARTPLTWDQVMAGALALMPVTTAVAVVRHGMLDVGRVLRRTASYALVTAILAAVYVGGVVGVGALVPATRGSDLLVALSTLAVAALFQPVRRRVQTAVDRRFNRSRYDARRIAEEFATSIRDQVDLTDLVHDLRHTATATIAPTMAVVWIAEERP